MPFVADRERDSEVGFWKFHFEVCPANSSSDHILAETSAAVGGPERRACSQAKGVWAELQFGLARGLGVNANIVPPDFDSLSIFTQIFSGIDGFRVTEIALNRKEGKRAATAQTSLIFLHGPTPHRYFCQRQSCESMCGLYGTAHSAAIFALRDFSRVRGWRGAVTGA